MGSCLLLVASTENSRIVFGKTETESSFLGFIQSKAIETSRYFVGDIIEYSTTTLPDRHTSITPSHLRISLHGNQVDSRYSGDLKPLLVA